MSTPRSVAVLIGSLRKESLTRKLATAMGRLGPETLRMRPIEIGDLPLYNEDREGGDRTPPTWHTFRTSVATCDAVLFVTPEYNRSVPGVLKNALDVGSRPYGKSVWDGKPAAVISVSPGAMGGFGANHHLRQSLVFLNMPTLQQPEAYIGRAAGLLADDGSFTSGETQQFLASIMNKFADFIEALIKP